uniref:Methyltransferase domain-containing protein n=1 Tax=Thermogemmatispora argillosa TaxID=2045280 RepID=A0A455T4N0_9CHLR|nr:hypothetical protein KTA_05530 [Thermogemmatispora argillosa]
MDERSEEQPGRNTYVIDSEEAAELARLMQQDRILTEALGGLFPEGRLLPEDGCLLDLACGPGGWALEVAFAYPHVEVIGVDISPPIVEYANAQAASRRLSNVHFRVMNVMEPLAFPDSSFDLINGRLMCGFMRAEAWPKLLAECRRLLKPGGVIRLTEMEPTLTTSPAFERFSALGSLAMQRAGQSFSPDARHFGITAVLPRLVRRAGFVDIHLHPVTIEWSADTPYHYPFFKDYLVFLDLIQPFMVRMGVASREELRRLYQQAIAEMQEEDFCAIWNFLLVWGQKPEEEAR